MTPMKATAATRVALKEWAVTIQALREGRQVLLLRKGGIQEPHGQLPAGPAEFFFFPGHEHQHRDLLKPGDAVRYERFFDPAREAGPPGVPPILPLRIDTFARLAADLVIDPPEKAYRLAAEHIWTEDYVRMRIEYRPEKPLHALVVRAYGLPRAIEIPRAPRYAGCRSWVDLDEELSADGACAALDDAAFAGRVDAMRSLLA
jgi:hypothetical protein